MPDKPGNTPIPYTGSPLLLCLSDLRLLLTLSRLIPFVLSPITQWQTGALDELYPSPQNLFCLLLHAFLLVFQTLFLLSLPFLIILPLWAVVVYLAGVFGVTFGVSYLLNGTADVLHSTVDLGEEGVRHEEECWVYLNGVSVGRHWLQSNLERLAYTFRRRVMGVHNRTYGIVFDLLQCVVERDFMYGTADIRRSYVTMKEAVLDPNNTKVVLILHSQGGIEGGLILDWLLTELPHDTLSKLEMYTFGSAANHFNNPPRHANPQSNPSSSPPINRFLQHEASTQTSNPHAVPHIEHYAATGDFVARWGVLHFSTLPNRYAGRIFVREGTGHLLNQHYLNALFPLGRDMRVKEEESEWRGVDVAGEESGEGMDGEVVEGRKKDARELSRLWAYRDGGSPED